MATVVAVTNVRYGVTIRRQHREPNSASMQVNNLYRSTIVVGTVDSGVFKRLGSGWVIEADCSRSVIITAGHVVDDINRHAIVIGYWTGRGDWHLIVARLERTTNKLHGDIAVLSVDVKLPALKLATSVKLNAGDEVLVGGVQHDIPPAHVTLGSIQSTDDWLNTFTTDGWAWFGHSGGPVVLRRTGEVIGIVAWATGDHMHDASLSRCPNYILIRRVLSELSIE